MAIPLGLGALCDLLSPLLRAAGCARRKACERRKISVRGRRQSAAAPTTNEAQLRRLEVLETEDCGVDGSRTALCNFINHTQTHTHTYIYCMYTYLNIQNTYFFYIHILFLFYSTISPLTIDCFYSFVYMLILILVFFKKYF